MKEIVMPQLGISMDEGQIVSWLKQDGEAVKQGEVLLEVETGKAIVEVEAVSEGVLHILLDSEAGPLKVGTVIGYLMEEGETLPEKPSEMDTMIAGGAPELASPMKGSKAITPGAKGSEPKRPVSTPAARRKAKELGVDWRLASPSGSRGQIRERDVVALSKKIVEATAKRENKSSSRTTDSHQEREVRLSPIARRLAEATGINVNVLAEGRSGELIQVEDVEKALRDIVRVSAKNKLPENKLPQKESHPVVSMEQNDRDMPEHEEHITNLRGIIAQRMAYSARTYASVTLTTKADATELAKIRAILKREGEGKPIPSYNVLLAVIVSRALLEHPILNATMGGQRIRYWDTVNIGIAVDTPKGLIVPVLRNVETKTVSQLAEELDALIKRVMAGKALADELTGGTFTITNLGVDAIDFFTPLINPPESAVLGVGRLAKEAIVIDDEVVIRLMVPLSLTFDHRIVDGAPAARFLKRIKQLIEHPYLWIV